ncbi:hypothetical protein MD273_14220 [Marinobacter pelagius]|uniref:hypothetical protein n=1 Tax=Marinobacter sp. C7 TaxID=2951363 RepID=UPI001EF05A0C|nr:hypothetical protein [Marinobacter sp. C7]MCG7200888.1 hypothetical protein [Marinobacter sp. C7]
MLVKEFLSQAFAPKYQINPTPEFRSTARKAYFFLHFVIGFYVLYLLNASLHESYEIAMQNGIVRKYSEGTVLESLQTYLFNSLYWNSFEFKSGTETIYLIIGVVWGSLGWDRLKSIKTDKDDSSFFAYFVVESSVCITLVGFVTAAINVSNRIMEGLFSSGSPTLEVLWICILGAIFVIGTSLLWTLAKDRNQETISNRGPSSTTS